MTKESYSIELSPANLPVAQEEVRLYHPVTPSTSSISPAKYNHGTIFDSMVFLFTSSSDTHPAVTNSSPALRPITDMIHHHQKYSARDRRSSFEHNPICHSNFHQNICVLIPSIIRSGKEVCNIVLIFLRGFSCA